MICCIRSLLFGLLSAIGSTLSLPLRSDSLLFEFGGEAAPVPSFTFATEGGIPYSSVSGEEASIGLSTWPEEVNEFALWLPYFDIVNRGGFRFYLPEVDWSGFDAIGFWLYGQNSGASYRFVLHSTRSAPSLDTSELYEAFFTDNALGWRYVVLRLEDFTRSPFQSPGASDAGFDLTRIYGWEIIVQGTGNLVLNNLSLLLDEGHDFEEELPDGLDSNGILLGYEVISSEQASASVSRTPLTQSAWVPGSDGENEVLRLSVGINSGFAGVLNRFPNTAGNTWVTQDWWNIEGRMEKYQGVGFWFYGRNTGATVFFDILDNRNPDSQVDDAERFTVSFADDFTGWQYQQFSYFDFVRKDIGNGDPDDGFNLNRVHGWAIGLEAEGISEIYYVDDVHLYPRPEYTHVDRWFLPGGNSMSDWLGGLNDFGGPLVYSWEHGWLYGLKAELGVFLYADDLGWSWTSDSVYPFFYQFGSEDWLYYLTGTGLEGTRWFYRFDSDSPSSSDFFFLPRFE